MKLLIAALILLCLCAPVALCQCAIPPGETVGLGLEGSQICDKAGHTSELFYGDRVRGLFYPDADSHQIFDGSFVRQNGKLYFHVITMAHWYCFDCWSQYLTCRNASRPPWPANTCEFAHEWQVFQESDLTWLGQADSAGGLLLPRPEFRGYVCPSSAPSPAISSTSTPTLPTSSTRSPTPLPRPSIGPPSSIPTPPPCLFGPGLCPTSTAVTSTPTARPTTTATAVPTSTAPSVSVVPTSTPTTLVPRPSVLPVATRTRGPAVTVVRPEAPSPVPTSFSMTPLPAIVTPSSKPQTGNGTPSPSKASSGCAIGIVLVGFGAAVAAQWKRLTSWIRSKF